MMKISDHDAMLNQNMLIWRIHSKQFLQASLEIIVQARDTSRPGPASKTLPLKNNVSLFT